MLDTLSDLRSVVQSDLNVSTNSSLFPPSRIDSAINRAYVKSSRLFRWPALGDAKKTSTGISQEHYDFPQSWSPESIWRLEVDGDMYGEEPDGSPMKFADYLIWVADYPNSTDKKWSMQYDKFFIRPVPTSVGSNNISIYGQKNITALSGDSSTTIFTYKMPECNEAIAIEASAILKKKGEVEAGMLSAEAKEILVIAFNKIRQEQAKKEKTQPFLNVPDYFPPNQKVKSGKSYNIGNF